MSNTTVLFLRLMCAAQKLGRRRGWKAAQRVLKAWQEWLAAQTAEAGAKRHRRAAVPNFSPIPT